MPDFAGFDVRGAVDKLVGEAQVPLEEQHCRAGGPLRAILTGHWHACEIGRTIVFTGPDIAAVFAVAGAIAVLHRGRVLAEGILNEARTDQGVYEVSLDTAAQGASVHDAFTTARDTRNWVIQCCGNAYGRPSPRTT